MLTRKPKPVLYRRKREQKTDYNKRLRLLLANKPRIVVRLTNQRLIGQLVEFTPKGDKVLESVDSFALRKLGWNYSCKNFPATYLTGLLLGRKIRKHKVKAGILDTGLINPLKKGKIYAFLQGVLESGLEIPHDKGVLPEKSSLQGEHIQKYASTIKEKEKGKSGMTLPFSGYLKNKAKPEEIARQVEEVKKKILSL